MSPRFGINWLKKELRLKFINRKGQSGEIDLFSRQSMNDDLEISLETDDDREFIRNSLERATDKGRSVIYDMLDFTRLSHRLSLVAPEDIGASKALTLSDSLSGVSWWFPNYQVESFAETLLATGRAVFPKAP